jgi:hypothetical protein
MMGSLRRAMSNYAGLRTKARGPGRSGMDTKAPRYVPPDQTRVDGQDPAAIDYWSRTLEVKPERLREAFAKAGPLLEDIKRELGIAGV